MAEQINGWTLRQASAISADGMTIVGLGRNPGGESESWVATLPALLRGDYNGDGVVDAADYVSLVTTIPGDYNRDGTVDAADYVVWRKTDGTPAGFNVWRAHCGQTAGSGSVAAANATVPEPTTLSLLMLVTASCCIREAAPHRGFRKLVNAWDTPTTHRFRNGWRPTIMPAPATATDALAERF